MKTYLFIYDVEVDSTELIMKVQPLYCANDKVDFLPINDKDYTPTKGDKLYFLPGVNIPRVKLKDLSLQHGIKTVRDINQATHVFCSKNTKDKLVTSHWYYSMPTQKFRDLLADADDMMDEYYKENLREALEHYTEDVVIVDYTSASELRNAELSVIQKHIGNGGLRSSSVYYTVDDDHKDLFPGILSLDLFNESKLLKHINGDDAATIDETMFNQICDMFKSSDSDNHILAMEIMANCNYMESLLFIEMLFEKYSNQMANCHTKNHVNFKSLISFLGKNKNYMGTSIDDVMKSLINKDVLDLEKIDMVMKYYGKEIAEYGGNDFFEVKSITLNENTAKLLNTNYVHEIIPDFVPEVPEVVEEVVDLNSLDNMTANLDDIEITDEDIEIAINRIERNELKEKLIASDEEQPLSESELNKPEDESNNNQIKEDDGDGFEWF